MSMRQQIRAWRASLDGLGNDARYWDLCRTYGDYSREVYAHLRACAEYQHTAAAKKAAWVAKVAAAAAARDAARAACKAQPTAATAKAAWDSSVAWAAELTAAWEAT